MAFKSQYYTLSYNKNGNVTILDVAGFDAKEGKNFRAEIHLTQMTHDEFHKLLVTQKLPGDYQPFCYKQYGITIVDYDRYYSIEMVNSEYVENLDIDDSPRVEDLVKNHEKFGVWHFGLPHIVYMHMLGLLYVEL